MQTLAVRNVLTRLTDLSLRVQHTIVVRAHPALAAICLMRQQLFVAPSLRVGGVSALHTDGATPHFREAIPVTRASAWVALASPSANSGCARAQHPVPL